MRFLAMKVTFRLGRFLLLVALFTPLLVRAVAQETNAAPPVVADYKIGPGDLLSISATDAPEFGGNFA